MVASLVTIRWISSPSSQNSQWLNVASPEIKSNYEIQDAKKELDKLSDNVKLSGLSRDMVLREICRLKESLNLSNDSHQFTCFYDFVFFICRENNQKSIAVSIAVDAWRLVLNGKFQLLDCWCDFVEKNQRYNISEDTWQQLLAFSRFMNEDLQEYDPKGAWPVLIDDFVEHMYRITESTECCSSGNMPSNYAHNGRQSCILNSLPGLVLHPGSKRKTIFQAPTLEETKRSRVSDNKNLSSFRQLSSINHSRMYGFESNPEENTPRNWEVFVERLHLSKCSNNARNDIH